MHDYRGEMRYVLVSIRTVLWSNVPKQQGISLSMRPSKGRANQPRETPFSLSQRWATHNLPLITKEKSFHYKLVERVLRDVRIVGMCLSPGRSNKLTLSELGHCVESYSKISSKIPTTLFSSMKKQIHVIQCVKIFLR